MPPAPQPLRIDENDANRPEIEAGLRALDDTAFVSLFHATRQAAQTARAAARMDELIDLTRALKTLHRLGAERNLVFRTLKRDTI